MSVISRNEKESRIQNIQQHIVHQKADACVISTPVNLYYLNGFVFDGYMFIFPNLKPILFVRRPVNIDAENVFFIYKPEQLPEILKKHNMAVPKSILLENDALPYNSVMRFQKALNIPELKNISGFMRKIRSVKSESELAQIRKSAISHANVYKQIPSLYRVGMTDLDLQIEIEYVMRKEGSIGVFRTHGENMDIYMGNLLAGDNAQEASPFDFALGGKGIDPLLPLSSADKTLKQGTTVMIDMAGNYTPYLSDMTRTFSVGEIADEAHRAHQLSIDIHNDIIGFAKEGVACADVYKRTMKMVVDSKMEQYFMGTTQQARFIGHGLGLEINEPPVFAPRSGEILQKNMAIALEPKFVLPGIGAVGIENTYFVTETGLEKVTVCEENIVMLK
ncbi:MAG TPA: Xaa-Pro peptidase family protein [Dysgonamonadaceae bacterium]|nr:Xaa-Pro peptidase family protein [Dysgonamonadaceae bacterium]